MTEHKIKDGVLVLVEISIDGVEQVRRRLKSQYFYIIGDYKATDNDTVLGTLSDLTEEQASELVERKHLAFGTTNPKLQGALEPALESLRSLIESKGMNPEQTILIKRKEK